MELEEHFENNGGDSERGNKCIKDEKKWRRFLQKISPFGPLLTGIAIILLFLSFFIKPLPLWILKFNNDEFNLTKNFNFPIPTKKIKQICISKYYNHKIIPLTTKEKNGK